MVAMEVVDVDLVVLARVVSEVALNDARQVLLLATLLDDLC